MRLSTSLALAAVGLAASALPAAAGTLLVPQRFPTIQKALDAAKPYDTVLVSPKADGKPYSEAVTISTPHVVLQGQNNPVIDGTGLGITVTDSFGFTSTAFPNGVEIRASHVAVRGLTVQNVGGSPFSEASGVNVGYVSTDGQTDVSYSDIEISGVTARNDYDGIMVMGYAGVSPYYGGTPTPLKGYRLLNNVITGSTNIAAQITGSMGALISGNQFTGNTGAGLVVGGNVYGVPPAENAQIVGNQFIGNTGDGMDAYGDGLLVSANEAAFNGYFGMAVTNSLYNPAVNDPNNPNPAPTAVAFNSVHDNQSYGLAVSGTQTVSGNVLSRNTGFGLYLYGSDYSTVSFNLITGTAVGGFGDDTGTGLYANGFSFTGPGGFLTISANEIIGNAGDGIFLAWITGSKVLANNVSGNKGIGIHLSDYPHLGNTPNIVTQNRALYNTLFDARDDSNAADNLSYNGYTSYGDNGKYGASINVWTRNLFGTTDPVGLSK